jgi:hypothetical protein
MNINKARKRLEKQVFIALRQTQEIKFDGTMLKLALNSHNRHSLTFSTPKC